MDRYEFRDGSSQKFWEVEVADDTLTVRFGKIGTAGQVKAKMLGNREAAEKERATLVREKTGKGYVPCGHARFEAKSVPSAPDAKFAAKPKVKSVNSVATVAATHLDSSAGASNASPVASVVAVAPPSLMPAARPAAAPDTGSASPAVDPDTLLAGLLARETPPTNADLADAVGALVDTAVAQFLVTALRAFVQLRQNRKPQAQVADRIAAAAAYREPELDKEQVAAVAAELSKLIAITDRDGSHVIGPLIFVLAGSDSGKLHKERLDVLMGLLQSTKFEFQRGKEKLHTDAALFRAGCLAMMFARGVEEPPRAGEYARDYNQMKECAKKLPSAAQRLFVLIQSSVQAHRAWDVAESMFPSWRNADGVAAEELTEQFAKALQHTSELPEADDAFRHALRMLAQSLQISADAATAGLVRTILFSDSHYCPDEAIAERAAALIMAGHAPLTEAALRDFVAVVREQAQDAKIQELVFQSFNSADEQEENRKRIAFGKKWIKSLTPPKRQGLPTAPKAVRLALRAHALKLEKVTKPDGDWFDRTHALLAVLSAPERAAWFAAAMDGFRKDVADTLADYEPGFGFYLETEVLCEARAAMYVASKWSAAEYGPVIAELARKECFVTLPGQGIRCEKLGNACLWALINMPEGGGVPYLARLLARVKYPKVKAKIELALNEAATAAGVTRHELDELTMPTHDLAGDGTFEVFIGDGRCQLAVVGSRDVELRWFGANGKQVASVPAVLKSYKAEIKAARDLAKEIEADLGTQVLRLQQMYLAERRWPATAWAQRYLDHPLVSGLTRRLIWNIWHGEKRVAVLWTDGALRNVRGEAVAYTGEVTPWHPVTCPVEEVLAWRERIETLGIVQPFKQAHREVYLTTDAERRTGTYSNRFAGHIVRQHQLMTLARMNGWMTTHRIWADTGNSQPTYTVLPAHNLLAEYWTMPSGGQDNPPVIEGSNAFMYLATDRLKFFSLTPENAALPMTVWGPPRQSEVAIDDVPAIVLSEIMRHCDLFVGVASIGNDTEWVDGGAAATHPNQWSREAVEYARGTALAELSGSGEVRRQVLDTLVPRLAFADRCKLQARHLRVQGKLRAYKIHLGSGNILMEPNDQYLCIVPKKVHEPDGVRVRLPFEGDNVLSIILSKAALLAADDKITDASIISQIGR